MASRREVLALQGPTITQGTSSRRNSPTLSTHQARWHSLQHWTDFPQRFESFWGQVGDNELSTVVDPPRYIDAINFLLQYTALPTSEPELYPIFDILYKNPHNIAASLNVSNFHATVQKGAAQYQPIGDPDYIFAFNGGLVGIIEVKTFWKVTPSSIDQVINGMPSGFIHSDLGTAPLEGYHAGRLAVEQTYGYMVRNGRKYGILTTINGFVFMYRENHGRLVMTRMASSSNSVPTIIQMIYFMSYLSGTAGPLPETDAAGQTLPIPAANYKHPVAAPQVPGPPPSPEPPQPPASQMGGYTGSTIRFILSESNNPHFQLVLEPWIRSNCLGGKSFKGRLLPDRLVVAKLWDSHSHNAADRDAEVQAYMKLQQLWGTIVPRLICSGEFDFCWGVVIEYVDVLYPNIHS